MSLKEDFIEITDIDSVKRALENAELEFEEEGDEDGARINLNNGVVFAFDANGMLIDVAN